MLLCRLLLIYHISWVIIHRLFHFPFNTWTDFESVSTRFPHTLTLSSYSSPALSCPDGSCCCCCDSVPAHWRKVFGLGQSPRPAACRVRAFGQSEPGALAGSREELRYFWRSPFTLNRCQQTTTTLFSTSAAAAEEVRRLNPEERERNRLPLRVQQHLTDFYFFSFSRPICARRGRGRVPGRCCSPRLL